MVAKVKASHSVTPSRRKCRSRHTGEWTAWVELILHVIEVSLIAAAFFSK